MAFADTYLFRFEKVRQQVNDRVTLAVHGTDGVEPELMKRRVAAGATKINVNRPGTRRLLRASSSKCAQNATHSAD